MDNARVNPALVAAMSRPLSAPGPREYDAGHEVASLLARRVMKPTRSPNQLTEDLHPTLLIALDDVDGWLSDPRKFEKRFHAVPWDTMANDARDVLDSRGPRLTAHMQAMSRLSRDLQAGSALGPDARRRGHLLKLSQLCREELGQVGASEAALDDLLDAAADLDTDYRRLDQLVLHLEASLAALGRRTGPDLLRLNDILDNRAWEIRLVLHQLGDRAEPPSRDEIMDDAGLSLDQRVELCHRLLRSGSGAAGDHHVVWLCYDNAKLRQQTVECGTVTFFKGPMLVEALNRALPTIGKDRLPVPAELLSLKERYHGQEIEWPSSSDDGWIAVRVDLGQGRHSNPLRAAAELSDALITLAAFYDNGTVWRRMAGHQGFRNGEWRQKSPFRAQGDLRIQLDHTGDALAEMAPSVAPHLPISDPALTNLLEIVSMLDTHHYDIDPVSIVHSVRAIEKAIGYSNQTNWYEYLKSHFRAEWAHDSIRDELTETLERIEESTDLGGIVRLPARRDLRPHPEHRTLAHAVLVAALDNLASQIPDYHPAARRVRTLARKTADTDQLSVWAEELAMEYDRLVDRLARCRNSLAHGGPIVEATARTVQSVAHIHAKRTVGTALDAFLDGTEPRDAIAAKREAADRWLSGLPGLATVSDAFEA